MASPPIPKGTPYDVVINNIHSDSHALREEVTALRAHVDFLTASRARLLSILWLLWAIQIVTAVVAVLALVLAT